MKYVVWTLTIMAIVAFWFSLRDQTQSFNFTLAALGLWAVAFVVNRYFVKKGD